MKTQYPQAFIRVDNPVDSEKNYPRNQQIFCTSLFIHMLLTVYQKYYPHSTEKINYSMETKIERKTSRKQLRDVVLSFYDSIRFN